MENEIEIKLMMNEANLANIKNWISQYATACERVIENTYFDTPDQFFGKNQMGLRVRRQGDRYEMTLKTQGEISGGLHIRPEYNLPLETNTPDLARFVAHFDLPAEWAQMPLVPLFSTDFTRTQFNIDHLGLALEIALDLGKVKNAFGEEAICEAEFELKRGKLFSLLMLLEHQMPQADEMWLSSLSKAQRGYLTANTAAIHDLLESLAQADLAAMSEKARFAHFQQIKDLIRSPLDDERLLALYQQIEPENTLALPALKQHLRSQAVLVQELEQLYQVASA